MQAYTKGINWTIVLGPDAENPDAVYYDGLTLLNASGKPLANVTASLKQAKPPTRKQLAYENLRAAGVDPDQQIDVKSLFIPAAYGPVKLTIPLPFALYKQALRAFYMERDKVALSRSSQPEDPTATTGATADVSAQWTRALAKLSNSLKDQFDSEFEKRKTFVAEHVAQIIDASISLYGKRHGIDMADASITVSRARRRITTTEFSKAEADNSDLLPPYPGETAEMQYQRLSALTREYLESVSVSYRPAA